MIAIGRRIKRFAVPLPLLLVSPGLAAQANTVQATGPSRPQTVVLREGTEVNLRFAQKLTAGAAVVDQPVELMLSEDLTVDVIVS